MLRGRYIHTNCTNFIQLNAATWLQVKDILLDCALSSPGTRPIICIDEYLTSLMVLISANRLSGPEKSQMSPVSTQWVKGGDPKFFLPLGSTGLFFSMDLPLLKISQFEQISDIPSDLPPTHCGNPLCNSCLHCIFVVEIHFQRCLKDGKRKAQMRGREAPNGRKGDACSLRGGK